MRLLPTVRPLALAAMLLLGASSPALADIPEPWRGRAIVEVRVSSGAQDDERPKEATALLGKPLSRALLRAALGQLLASGRYRSVQVDALPVAQGVVLLFEVQPRITLRRIDLAGNVAASDGEVRGALDLADGAEVTPDDLEPAAAVIRKLYAERGYLGARVEVGFRDTDDPGQKVLMVRLDEGEATTISAVRFDGHAPRDPQALLSAMGLALGDTLDRRALAQSAQAGEQYLRAHRHLEARVSAPVVAIVGTRATVAFPTHIGPRYRFEVRGSGALTAREVLDALSLGSARLTEESLAALPGRIQDLYARHGFLDARVSIARTSVARDATARLTFRIDPGPQLEIVDATFTGVSHFPEQFLRDQLVSYLEEDLPDADLIHTVDSERVDELSQGERSRLRQVPRPMAEDPARVYYEPTYREALEHVTELYQGAGFLSVSVGPAVLRRVGETRATITIPVVEGPQTRLHTVVIEGQRQRSTRELLLVAGLQRGAPFSYLRLEEARLQLLQHYAERGYTFAKVEPRVRFSDDRTRAEVTLQIVERFPVHVGEIVIRGAERTSPDFVRGLLSLRSGDLFRPSEARKSEEALQSLGVLTGVSVGLLDPDLPARVKPLLVTVSERTNQYLDFGAGVSTGQGVRAGFEYGYRNLLGRAVGLSLRVQFAHQLFFVREELRERFSDLLLEQRLERNIGLGVVIPRLPGLGSTRTAVDLVHVRDNERDFGLDKNGVTLTFTETPLSRVTLTQAADLENNNVDLFVGDALDVYLAQTDDARLRRLLRVPEGDTTLVGLRAGASYDTRDSPFVPTRGYFASSSAELGSTLASETIDLETGRTQFVSRFVKLQVAGSGYLPLGRTVVFAAQARVGRIVHLLDTSKTYPNRAFFLGGVDTMRGYFQDEMIPQDIADEILADPNLSPNSIVRSGDAFILARAELRFPIYGQLGGGLFTDAGNLWADAAHANPFELRPTAGAGVRLSTPVGPIAVDYGVIIKRRRALGEPFGTLHFSIGLF